jgi:hypothetical protein
VPPLLPLLLLLADPPLELLALPELLVDADPVPEELPESSELDGPPSGPRPWTCDPSSCPLLASYPVP